MYRLGTLRRAPARRGFGCLWFFIPVAGGVFVLRHLPARQRGTEGDAGARRMPRRDGAKRRTGPRGPRATGREPRAPESAKRRIDLCAARRAIRPRACATRGRGFFRPCGAHGKARHRVEAWFIYGLLCGLRPGRCAARWLHDACRGLYRGARRASMAAGNLSRSPRILPPGHRPSP